MQESFWKRCYSYLDDILIEEVSSEYSEVLQVYLSKGRYQLSTEDAIYSYADKYENFVHAFRSLEWSTYDFRNALLLGLGLASIPYMLEKIFHREIDFTAIEIDEAVSFLANKYVIKELSSNIEVVHADAHMYMAQETNKYDLVCMDIFIGNQIPEAFTSDEFIQRLAEVVSENGLLLFNLLHKGFEEQSKDIINKCTKHFSKVWFEHVEDNIVVFGRHHVK